jgi:chromosomal replication initiator protein
MKAWDNFLLLQEAELGADTVDKWLRSLKILRYDACNIHLEVKDSFQALWFEEHIRPKVLNKLQNNNGKLIKVHLKVANAIPSEDAAKSTRKINGSKKPQLQPVIKFALPFDELDPSCRFENLAIGPSNELAAKLLMGLCDGTEPSGTPGAPFSFNPIYIHGSKGSGKTHLLMATAERLKKKGLQVIYCRAETFTEHVISAIRAGEMSSFRKAYRKVDVLIIDDVQTFGRKATTQEEFFHTFNTLHTASKQIILASNSRPGMLQSIEPRLISRFEWGVVLPLELQTSEELIAMLNFKAETFNYKLSSKLATFLLDTFTSGSKALMQGLQALILRSHFNAVEGSHSNFIPTPQQAETMLADLIAEENKAKLTTEKIILQIAENFGIRPEDIFKKGQSRDCVLPRQIAMYFFRHELKMPFTKIGDFFSKDHSTVMSSVRLVDTAIKNQVSEFTDPYNAIRKKLHE